MVDDRSMAIILVIGLILTIYFLFSKVDEYVNGGLYTEKQLLVRRLAILVLAIVLVSAGALRWYSSIYYRRWTRPALGWGASGK